MFKRRRTWLGLALAVLGIVLARVVSPVVSEQEMATVIYLLGIALALGGLALIASAIQVTQVSVVICHKCHLANHPDSERCARCGSPMGDGDDQPGKPQNSEEQKDWKGR